MLVRLVAGVWDSKAIVILPVSPAPQTLLRGGDEDRHEKVICSVKEMIGDRVQQADDSLQSWVATVKCYVEVKWFEASNSEKLY